MPIRDRIVGFKKISKNLLIAHPGHVWEHPETERQELRDRTEDVGVTSVLLVRPHPAPEHKGKFEVIDGKMRMEEINLPELSCIITDLDDAEAKDETRNHNYLPQLAFTHDVEILARLEAVKSEVPDVDAMLKDAPVPEVGGDGEPAEADKSVIEKQRKEIKAQTPASTVKLFLITPMSEYGRARELVAALEAMSLVVVNKAGVENA